MRPLHWDRILLGERQGKTPELHADATSIWHKVKEPTSLNLDLLDALLQAPNKKKKRKKRKGTGQGDKVIGIDSRKRTSLMRVVDPGRAQTVAITLSKLPEIPVIVDAIRKLDGRKLTRANIMALAKLGTVPGS